MFGKKKRTYLDAAAGVRGNPGSPHAEGRAARAVLEAARTKIARLVEAQADDVIFTSGATESNALAILGSTRAAREGISAPKVLYLPSAHASVVENVALLKREGVVVEPLPIRDYRVDTRALEERLTPGTVLVTMDAVCGETGVVWNTREVKEILRTHAPKGLLHVDASQAPYTEKLTRDHFGADLLTLDGAKVTHARGSGVLVAHRTIPLMPLYAGGGQERSLRSGTPVPELAAAFAEGLTSAAATRESFRVAALAARESLLERITSALTDVYIQEGPNQAPQILNLSLVGRDTDYLVALLDEAGFGVATRSACETDSVTGSRAVLALTGDPARAKATLRISWLPSTKARDIEHFADALISAAQFVDSTALR